MPQNTIAASTRHSNAMPTVTIDTSIQAMVHNAMPLFIIASLRLRRCCAGELLPSFNSATTHFLATSATHVRNAIGGFTG